jgi:nucleoside-diphosphate-sugar epimerase
MSQRAVRPVLVTSARGKTGRRIAERLTDADIPLRAASRSSTPAFDWSDRSTWSAALAGVRAAYIAYQPDLAVPAALSDIAHFVELARSAGVEQLVLLSGRGEVEAEACEEVLLADDLPSELGQLMRYLFTTVLDGRNASLTEGVQRALGRAPRDFRQYAQELVVPAREG